MKLASCKGHVTLSIEVAKSLEQFLLRVSSNRRLNDEQKMKAHEHAMLLTETLAAASSKISLPKQVVLAALQCLALSLRHRNCIRKWVETLMGDE